MCHYDHHRSLWSSQVKIEDYRVSIHNDCDADFIILYIAVEQAPFKMIVANLVTLDVFFMCFVPCAKNYVVQYYAATKI